MRSEKVISYNRRPQGGQSGWPLIVIVAAGYAVGGFIRTGEVLNDLFELLQ